MKIILIALLLLSIISCSEEAEKQPRKNEITKVSYGHGSVWTGKVYQVEIDSSLNYKLFKIEIGKPNQNYTGKISWQMWDSLNIKFERLGYSKLDTIGCVAVDGPEAGLIVFKNGRSFKGYHCFKNFPEGFNEAIDWLIATQEKVALKETADSLSFEFPIMPFAPAPVLPRNKLK
ncbi:MAG TPA: hypothetical protein VEC36_09385 [Patescibacteria group bacterium]|nr:hypothetical protein [Patescibacteria group bacterium]